MPDKCRQCGSEHLIQQDHMVICDDCLSTIVLKEDGSVLAEYLTNEAFKKTYAESKGSININDERFHMISKNLLSRQGDNPALLNLLGMYYIRRERYGDAIKVLKQAVDLNPLYVTACYNLAVAYHYFGYNELSVKYYEEARKNVDMNDERYIDIMSGCALALSETGRSVKAEDYLEKAEAKGFSHGDEVRAKIGTKKLEDDEIPGTNRNFNRTSQGTRNNASSGTNNPNSNRSGYQSNTDTPPNRTQQSGEAKPVWPYYTGIAILAIVIWNGWLGTFGFFVMVGAIVYLSFQIVKVNKINAANGVDNFASRRRRSSAENAYKEALKFAEQRRNGYYSMEYRALNQSESIAYRQNESRIAELRGKLVGQRQRMNNHKYGTVAWKNANASVVSTESSIRNLEFENMRIKENAKVQVWHDPDPTVKDPNREEVYRKTLGDEWYEILYGNNQRRNN